MMRNSTEFWLFVESRDLLIESSTPGCMNLGKSLHSLGVLISLFVEMRENNVYLRGIFVQVK